MVGGCDTGAGTDCDVSFLIDLLALGFDVAKSSCTFRLLFCEVVCCETGVIFGPSFPMELRTELRNWNALQQISY